MARLSSAFSLRSRRQDAAWMTMLRLVIAFGQQYPAEAVLLFEGCEILMRCHDGEIIFDTTEYFHEIPHLAAIVSEHRQETLAQPFM